MSSNNSSCSDFNNSWIYVGLGATEAAFSLVSFLSVFLMIVLIFLFRKQHFFTQRLILYLAFSALFKSLVGIVDIIGYWEDTSNILKKVCISLGFLQQVADWWTALAAFCIMLDLFLKVVFKWRTAKVELFYIVIIFLSPVALTSWIPFLYNAYGPVEAICWIRLEENDTCTQFIPGIALQLGINSIPLILLMSFILALLTITLASLYQQRRRWAGSFDPQEMKAKKMMLKEVKSVIYYPFIILLVNLPMTVHVIYVSITGTNNMATIVMWYVNDVIMHLDGTLITCISALDSETRSMLTCANIRAACASCFCCQKHVSKDYPSAMYGSMGDSLIYKHRNKP